MEERFFYFVGIVFLMVFTFFLKDNAHIVIVIENSGIIVTGAIFLVFQAC